LRRAKKEIITAITTIADPAIAPAKMPDEKWLFDEVADSVAVVGAAGESPSILNGEEFEDEVNIYL
jgi:hypothetical protein